ncbi:hypothetical protein LCGC14_0805800 [marine sediment metagenome]|uniref:Uncharacterized protein n=1 Tax=marine sediment metagenome TaxID=412755 RepID=A0A0F9S8A7_9ZZZZ
MRIKCAKCGWLHDSMITPFEYDIVPDAKANADGYIMEKNIESEFVCKHCGVTNYVQLNWYTSWTWKEKEDEFLMEKKRKERNNKDKYYGT